MASSVTASDSPIADAPRKDTGSRLLTETRVARASLALVALHVVDDNFLQPQPGTSAGDHLVSGLVPLALLAATAWLYPRLRAGARATTAITVGVLAIVGGVAEAAYYTLEVGPS